MPQWTDRPGTPQPWSATAQGIVATHVTWEQSRYAHGAYARRECFDDYGGELVCESINYADMRTVLIAVRHNEAIKRILAMTEDYKQLPELRAKVIVAYVKIVAEVDAEIHAARALSSFRYRMAMMPDKPLQLPETATRARIEPYLLQPFMPLHWTTDNIEQAWVLRQAGVTLDPPEEIDADDLPF